MIYTKIFGHYSHAKKWATIYRRTAETELINHVRTDKIETVYDKAVTYETYKRNLRKWLNNEKNTNKNYGQGSIQLSDSVAIASN